VITVKQATLEDEADILDLAARFIAEEHIYREVLGFDAETLGDTLKQVLRVGVVLLAEIDGRPIGILAGAAVDSLTARDRYFDEVVWYVEPEARKTRAGYYLLRDAIAWAHAEGCSSCKMVAPAGSTVGTFLERNGFRAVETAFHIRIDEWPRLRRSGSASSSERQPPAERPQRLQP
jgi:GNAT superfamily N-acetyltransferase